MNDIQPTIETLNRATVDQRASYVARAEELYIQNLIRMRQNLAANAMDINKVAPYPKSFRMSKRDFRMAKAAHDRYMASFETVDKAASFTLQLDGKLPWVVKEKADAEPKLRAIARQDANACFDSYINKLAGKIGKPVKDAKLEGNLWDGSRLTVTLDGDVTEQWTTKCIVNCSIYGKLFNQWPTRKVA